MAIDLLNSFLQRGQNVSSGQKSNTSNAIQTTQNLPQNLQVMRAIRALRQGTLPRESAWTAAIWRTFPRKRAE